MNKTRIIRPFLKVANYDCNECAYHTIWINYCTLFDTHLETVTIQDNVSVIPCNQCLSYTES